MTTRVFLLAIAIVALSIQIVPAQSLTMTSSTSASTITSIDTAKTTRACNSCILLKDPVLERRTALFRIRTVSAAASALVGASTLTSFPRASVATTDMTAFIAKEIDSIASRLDTSILSMPPPPSGKSELNGVDNLYYPSFLQGEWSVTQTLIATSTPLGLKFVGGPNGVEDIAKASMDEANSKIGKPVSLRLRYLPTKWGVAEDRLFNTRQRLDAFAEKTVVAAVDYNNVGASNRPSVLAMGGNEDDPLQTTFVRFKGPAAQKTFVLSHGIDAIISDTTATTVKPTATTWAGYELDRSIFALTNQSTAPPLTTDSELIWMFEKINDDTLKAKLRIAGYLNAQSDTLYFVAKNRAVILQDYVLEFKRVEP